jgi:hypothetical protein
MDSPGVRLRNGKKLHEGPLAKRVYQRKASTQNIKEDLPVTATRTMPSVNDFEQLNVSSTTCEGATSGNVTLSSTSVQCEDLQSDSDDSLTTVVDELSFLLFLPHERHEFKL